MQNCLSSITTYFEIKNVFEGIEMRVFGLWVKKKRCFFTSMRCRRNFHRETQTSYNFTVCDYSIIRVGICTWCTGITSRSLIIVTSGCRVIRDALVSIWRMCSAEKRRMCRYCRRSRAEDLGSAAIWRATPVDYALWENRRVYL